MLHFHDDCHNAENNIIECVLLAHALIKDSVMCSNWFN